MADVTPADLADAGHLLVIASTWGEGDPPERAVPFYSGADGRGRAAPRGAALCRAGARRFELRQLLRGRQADRRAPRGAGRRADRAAHRLRPRLRGTGGRLDRALARGAAQGRRTRAAGRGRRARRDHPRRLRDARGLGLVEGEPVRRRDHRARQPQRQVLGQADDPPRARPRGLRPRLRARRLPRHRQRERSLDGRGRAPGRGPRGRRRARGAARDRARHHGALAAGDGGLRQGQPGDRRSPSCSRATAGAPGSRAARSSTCSRRFPASSRPSSWPACSASCRRASTRSPPRSQGDARGGASAGRPRALREPRPRAPGRRLGLRRRAPARRRPARRLRQAQQELPPARGPGPAGRS